MDFYQSALVDDKLPIDTDGICKIYPGAYGWEVEQYNDSSNTWINKQYVSTSAYTTSPATSLNGYGYAPRSGTTYSITDQYNDSFNIWLFKSLNIFRSSATK